MIRVSSSTTVTLTEPISVEQLQDILNDLPDSATIRWQAHAPDRPGVDSGSTTMHITYEGTPSR